ncbi:hypothetical protein ABIF74_008963 [Bradyrhizobium japonicum]
MIPGGGGTRPLLDDKADPARVGALLDWVRQMDGDADLLPVTKSQRYTT